MNNYTISVTDQSNLIATGLEQSIAQIAESVVLHMGNYLSWRGTLDLEVRVLPNSELTWSDANGLAPALGSHSWNGTGWTSNTLAEAITGIDPVSGDAEIGCFLYLGSDNLPRNYGDLFWFDPFPSSSQQVKVPTGEVDFYGVLLHEIFHCLGFWGSSEEWISRVETRDGFHYFVGDKVEEILGGDLLLAPPYGDGTLPDHYGNDNNVSNTISSGLLYQWGNYELNRLDIGQIDLAVLEDMGHTIKTYEGLPVFEAIDNLQIEDNTQELRYLSTYLDETITASNGMTELTIRSNKANFELANIDNSEAWSISGIGIGTDTLSGFKRLEFDDGTFAMDIGQSETAGQAYRLYQAAFARTPDMPGVAFHMNDMETHGHAITQIAGNFIASPEFKSTYGENISEETYINLLYQNVLGRSPADFEVEYYTERFASGTTDWNTTLVFFAESPENVALVAPQIEDGIWMPF